MKKAFPMTMIAAAVLAACAPFALAVQDPSAEDGPPNPGKNATAGSQSTSQSASAKKQEAAEQDAGQVDAAIASPYAQASFNYLMRAYAPQQGNEQQTKAIQDLMKQYALQYYNYAGQAGGNQSADGQSSDDAVNNWMNLAQQYYLQQAASPYTWQNYAIPGGDAQGDAAQTFNNSLMNFYRAQSDDEQNKALQGYNNAILNYYRALGGNQGTAYQYYEPANAYQFLLYGQNSQVSDFWLGLQTGPLAESVRPFLDLPEGQGVVVISVADDSPAGKAGLQVNDIVLTLGGKPISKVNDLYAIVGEVEDNEAEMEIVRRGEKMTLNVTATKRPQPEAAQLPGVQDYLKDLQNIPQGTSPYVYSPGVYSPWTSGGSNERLEKIEKSLAEIMERLEKLESDR